MVIHSPYLEWDHRNIMHYPNAKEGIFERFRDTMAPVMKRAEAVGTTLMLENISDIDPNFRVELDVNPIILDSAGRATAVDALLRIAQE